MHSFTQISTYVMTLGLAALIPGPGMTGLMFKTLSKGYLNGFSMLLGLITGDLIFLMITLFSMSSIEKMSPYLFKCILIFSCIYLTYLAYKFWIFDANSNIIQTDSIQNSHGLSSYFDGLFITLSNPKTISFYLALVPAIFGNQLNQSSDQILILFCVTVFTLSFVGGIYIIFSFSMKQKLNQPRIQRLMFKSTSILMFVVALKMLVALLIN